jgi:hypothetical protein
VELRLRNYHARGQTCSQGAVRFENELAHADVCGGDGRREQNTRDPAMRMEIVGVNTFPVIALIEMHPCRTGVGAAAGHRAVGLSEASKASRPHTK